MHNIQQKSLSTNVTDVEFEEATKYVFDIYKNDSKS